MIIRSEFCHPDVILSSWVKPVSNPLSPSVRAAALRSNSKALSMTGVVLLHILLRDFEELSFGILHQIIDVDSFVKGPCLYAAGVGDELAGEMLLCYDAGVVFDVGRRDDFAAQLCDVEWATHQLKVSLLAELLGDSDDVYGVLCNRQVLYGLINLLMLYFIE